MHHDTLACKGPFFGITIAEAETVIEPHAVADDLCGKALMFLLLGRSRGVHTTIMPPSLGAVEILGSS
jgi:hypothetical protein